MFYYGPYGRNGNHLAGKVLDHILKRGVPRGRRVETETFKPRRLTNKQPTTEDTSANRCGAAAADKMFLRSRRSRFAAIYDHHGFSPERKSVSVLKNEGGRLES